MAAFLICVVALAIWCVLLTIKFYHFGYYDWDLAFFAQGMWGLLHGSGYVSLFGTNFFFNHANLIAYLILPLYKLFPHPLTLVFLKVVSYVTAGFVFYLLAKEKVGPATAILFLGLYLLYIHNVFGILYEFDFESLAPAVLVLLYYYYVKGLWPGFLICAGALVLIKENMPLIVLAFSIHGLCTKKDKIRFGVIPGILALVSFYLLVYVFLPHVSGRPIGEEHSSYIGNNYKDFGGSVKGVLFSFIFHPVKIWQHLVTPFNLIFLAAIFAPLSFLPLGRPGILFLISPILVQHLLSSSRTEHAINYAYVLTFAPFLFLATTELLGFFYVRVKRRHYFILILTILVTYSCHFIYFLRIYERMMWRGPFNQTREMISDKRKLVDLVPRDAGVVASFCFLAPLSQRKDLYSFFKLYDSHYQNDRYSYKLPSRVQYALIDTQESWLVYENDYDLAKARAQKFLTSGNWIIVKRYGRYILYQKRSPSPLFYKEG